MLSKILMQCIQVQPSEEVLFRFTERETFKGPLYARQIEVPDDEELVELLNYILRGKREQRILFLFSTWGVIPADQVDPPRRNT